jgi:hypothetical protein
MAQRPHIDRRVSNNRRPAALLQPGIGRMAGELLRVPGGSFTPIGSV